MIAPTQRTVLLLAAGAPIALVIAAIYPSAWAIGVAWSAVVLLMTFADFLMAATKRDFEADEPFFAEVGRECAIETKLTLGGGFAEKVEAFVETDDRLHEKGRTIFSLNIADDEGEKSSIFTGAAKLVPNRRGPGEVRRIGVRWAGPMGLIWRQYIQKSDHIVRVTPDVAQVRSPNVQLFLRDALYGIVARKFRGEGTEFDALADYQPGMDRRNIDWKGSARHTRLLAKEYDTERNNQIVFAIDTGSTMCEPIGGLPRIDRAVSAALLTGYAALKSGDRVSMMAFADRPQSFSPFVTGTNQFHRLQSEAGLMDYSAKESNYTLALSTLSARLQRRSLIVIFTDFTDTTSAEMMLESVGRLVDKHLVLFLLIADDELANIAEQRPSSIDALAESVTADALISEKQFVVTKLQRMGVDVIEAPREDIGTHLLNAYLRIKRRGAL